MNLGPSELLIILAVLLLLVGGSRLPALARSLGRSQREFRAGIEGKDSADADTGDRDGNKKS